MAYMRLGDLLVSSGIITGEQLEQALALPREDGQRLGDVLIRQGVISEAQLIDALRVQLGVDFVDLTAVSIPVELAKYVPRNLAKKFLVVPVKLVQDRLYLAMHDPLDFVAQDEVKTASRKRIIPMIATRKAVEQAIERLYGSEGTARVIEEMKREAGAGEDIIAVGEIRDGETASIAMRAAITGHLVFSTLHTNDAVSAVHRLEDIGVEPWLVSSALRGVVSQRLVRKLCPHCKTAYRPSAEELLLLGLPEDSDVTFYKGAGCPECRHSGYIGRRAVFEILLLNSRLRRCISHGADGDELLAAARQDGFTTLRESCRELVLAGVTSAAEAARVINTAAET